MPNLLRHQRLSTLLLLLPLVYLASLTSCQLGTKETAPEKTKKPPVRDHLVGIVTSVNNDYVLIQKYGAWKVPEEDILFSKGPEGQTANLKFSGEQLGQFIAADIRSGNVKLKDGVYWRQILSTKGTTGLTKPEEPNKPIHPIPSSTPIVKTTLNKTQGTAIPPYTPPPLAPPLPNTVEPKLPPPFKAPTTGNTQWKEIPPQQ